MYASAMQAVAALRQANSAPSGTLDARFDLRRGVEAMTSYSKEVIRDLVAGTLPWPQTRRIMSAYKDDDRFFKYRRGAAGPRRLEGPDPAAGRRSSLHLPERRRARDAMRMRPFLRRLSQELEAEGRDHRARHRGGAARDLSEQRHPRSATGWRSASSSARSAARCTRSRRPRPAIRSCTISSPISKASIATGWADMPLSPEALARQASHELTICSGRSAIITGGLTGQGSPSPRRWREEAPMSRSAPMSRGRRPAGRCRRLSRPRRDRARPRGACSLRHQGVRRPSRRPRQRCRSKRFVAEAEAACGPADILVNAAGTTAEQPVCGHSDELWRKIIDTNLNGAFRMTRDCCPA